MDKGDFILYHGDMAEKKGKILLGILGLIQEGVVNIIDLEMAIISAGYGASMGKIDWEYAKIKRARDFSRYQVEANKEKQRRLAKYLWKLKKDGLVREPKAGELCVTKKGEKVLDNFREGYEKKPSKQLVIVSFDIPEVLRRGRNMLRENLKLLDFHMVHQSTWFGKNKIPEELLNELEKIGVLEYIKIFEVTKSGTLVEDTPPR